MNQESSVSVESKQQVILHSILYSMSLSSMDKRQNKYCLRDISDIGFHLCFVYISRLDRKPLQPLLAQAQLQRQRQRQPLLLPQPEPATATRISQLQLALCPVSSLAFCQHQQSYHYHTTNNVRTFCAAVQCACAPHSHFTLFTANGVTHILTQQLNYVFTAILRLSRRHFELIRRLFQSEVKLCAKLRLV